MGNFDGSDKIHHDDFDKKCENINMHGRSIDNLKTTCFTNSMSNLKYVINMECLLKYSFFQLSETLFWESYQQAKAFY